MNHINHIYDNLINENFQLSNKCVLGIDLLLANNDTIKMANRFFDCKGYLKKDETIILQNCFNNLNLIVPVLVKKEKQYFASLKQLSQEILNIVNFRKLSDSEINLRHDWGKVYDKIKMILNELDPLGISDIVDDEYDDLNFEIYRQLIKNKNETMLIEIIKQVLSKDYEVKFIESSIIDTARKLTNIKV